MNRFLSAVVSLLVTKPGLVFGKACINNLSILDKAIKDKDPFVVETYILCPNTVFNVGFLDSNNEYDGGDPAIAMRANSRILCGEEGSSANNCILRGGGYQVITTVNQFVNEDPINVLLSGLTFESPKKGNGALLVSPGEITFNDCIFRNGVGTIVRLIYFKAPDPDANDQRQLVHSGEMNVVAFINDPIAQEENLQRIEKHLHNDRLLQRVSTTHLLVNFENCKFEKNSYGGEMGLSIIDLATPLVIARFKNTVFYQNDYKTDAIGPSFLIFSSSEGAQFEMESNCFIHNSVAGNAVVTLAEKPEGVLLDNFGTHVSGLECQFIFVNGTCIEFDAAVCPLPFEYEDKSTSRSASSIVFFIHSVGLGVLTSIMLSI